MEQQLGMFYEEASGLQDPENPFWPANVNGQPDYGDQARASENPSVIAGYQYTAWHQACHK